MGEFKTLIACLLYQKIVDPVGKHEAVNLKYNVSIKEFHILTLVAAGYISIPEIYQALKYLRLFLSYSSIFVYIKRMEDKQLLHVIQGKGNTPRSINVTPTLQGYTILQQIEAAILDKSKNKFRPEGNQGKPWATKALKHIRFNANGNEVNGKGQIKGLEYVETRGRKPRQKPEDITPGQSPSE